MQSATGFRDTRITEKVSEGHEVAGLRIDLIERKGECLAGLRGLIQVHKVLTASVGWEERAEAGQVRQVLWVEVIPVMAS